MVLVEGLGLGWLTDLECLLWGSCRVKGVKFECMLVAPEKLYTIVQC